VEPRTPLMTVPMAGTHILEKAALLRRRRRKLMGN
jgi:hypothetical protein